MQIPLFSSLSSILLALTTITSAAPAISPANMPTTELHTRGMNVGGWYACKNINWGGDCMYQVIPMNTCWNFPQDWQNVISSFGPDLAPNKADAFSCTLHSLVGCDFESATFAYPGENDLFNEVMNDKAQSVHCYYEDPAKNP